MLAAGGGAPAAGSGRRGRDRTDPGELSWSAATTFAELASYGSSDEASEFTDAFWAASPLHFVPRLSGRHLDVLKTRLIVLASGEGRAEDLGESWRMANTLGAPGIPNHVDP